MLLIGLMSGTSADGVDAALVEISGEGRATRIRLRAFVCLPFSARMRAAVLRACEPAGADSSEICRLDFALGELFAEAARRVAASAGASLADVDAVASHGQTVWHQPEAAEIGGVTSTGTLQIGSAAVISERTGCAVVSDFRTADMAAGGQGAPLVTYADWALLASDAESRAVLNIGGIANITVLPAGAGVDEVLAFDTGPGNMVIDGVVAHLSAGARRFDAGGAQALTGITNMGVVEKLLSDTPYFAAPPPKTTGREQFGAAFVERLIASLPGAGDADVVATATALTAESIARAHRDFVMPRVREGLVDTVIVGGGGARNNALMGMLRDRLAPTRLTTHAEYGIPNDAKEAIAFSLLGYETLHGRPSNVPSATGARRPVVLGTITPARRRSGDA